MEDVQKLEDAFPMKAQKLLITLPAEKAEISLLEDVFAMLSRNQGKCEVYFNLHIAKGVSVNILSQPLRIQGTRQLEDQLKQKGCQVKWQLN